MTEKKPRLDPVPVVKPPEGDETPKNPSSTVSLRLVTAFPLTEPFSGQMFNPGIDTEVSEITPWLRMQLDAGLMEQV